MLGTWFSKMNKINFPCLSPHPFISPLSSKDLCNKPLLRWIMKRSMILKFSFIDEKFHLKHQQRWMKVIPNINEAAGKWHFYKWLMGEYLLSLRRQTDALSIALRCTYLYIFTLRRKITVEWRKINSILHASESWKHLRTVWLASSSNL